MWLSPWKRLLNYLQPLNHKNLKIYSCLLFKKYPLVEHFFHLKKLLPL